MTRPLAQSLLMDCLEQAPWDDAAESIEPVQDFVDYWLSVARGENAEYDAATGARLEI
jgi:hypothetical protein